jgi:hypothetical protein
MGWEDIGATKGADSYKRKENGKRLEGSLMGEIRIPSSV